MVGMIIRRARYDDMQLMADFMEEYHKECNLSDIPFDRRDVVKTLDYFISNRNCNPLVAFKGGAVKGLLLAELAPFFFNSKNTYITDTAFIAKGAGMQLLRKLKEWQEKTQANRIIIGVSSGEPRADQFLELSGFEKTGSMYVFRR